MDCSIEDEFASYGDGASVITLYFCGGKSGYTKILREYFSEDGKKNFAIFKTPSNKCNVLKYIHSVYVKHNFAQ